MIDARTSRARFAKDAFLRPAGAVVAVPYAIWGLLAFVRDEIVQPRNVALWKPVFWLSKLPWHAWLVATLAIATGVLFEGAYRLLRRREQELLALDRGNGERPDVRLEGTFPGVFALRATGHACEIRTGPIVQDSGIVGIHKDGERTMPVVTQRYVLEFPVISDLRDGEKAISPALFCEDIRHAHGRSGWPKAGVDAAMTEFFRNAMLVRRSPDKAELKAITDEKLVAILNGQRQPSHFPFTVTFWNSDHTQQWIREELLVYEPRTNTAFVRHSGQPTVAVSANGRSLASGEDVRSAAAESGAA